VIPFYYKINFWLAGKLEAKRGARSAAASAYRRAANWKNAPTDWQYKLGQVLFENKDWHGADAAFTKATSAHKSDKWFYQLGRTKEKRKDWRGAVEAYRACVQQNPKNAKAHYRLALNHQRLREWPNVVASLAEALRRKPRNRKWQKSFARACRKTKNHQAVLAAIRHVHASGKKPAESAAFQIGPISVLANFLETSAPTVSKHEALEILQTLEPLQTSLPERWWLVAYQRFFMMGLPHHAYLAKRIAANVAIAGAKTVAAATANEKLKTAQALIMLDRAEDARPYLDFDKTDWPRLQRARVRQLRAHVDLIVQKKIGASVSNWRVSGSDNMPDRERRFYDTIRGKSVAIVAPADTGLKLGNEIDTFDVIVRTNIHTAGMIAPHADRLGNRTTVSYYNAPFERELRSKILEALRAEPVSHVVLRKRISPEWLQQYDLITSLRFLSPAVHFYHGNRPLGLPRMLWDILRFSPSRIKVFNADFYAGANKYHAGYQIRDVSVLADMAYHDLPQNFALTKQMHEQGLFEADPVLTEVLGWPFEYYLSRVESALENVRDRKS
jgi:tetratricopeptide (TPR) repeat protein